MIAGLIVIAAELGFWRYDKVWQYRMPPPYPKRLEHRLRLEEAGYGPLKRARVKYAVLIGGSLNNPKDRIERGVFRQETEKVYLTLRGMGFLPENMYVLQSDTKGDPELSYQVDDVASFESLRMTFDHLRKVVDDNDLLLVYYGTHGGSVWVNEDPSTGRRLRQRISLSYFWLQNQGLLQTTFFDLLLGIRPEVGLLYFGQCRGGGFADELERRVRRQKHLARFVAVALVDQYSNARAGFILALMDAYGSGRVEADRNGDGAISLDEAFTYAKATDWPTREGMNRPFLKGVPDPNLVFLER